MGAARSLRHAFHLVWDMRQEGPTIARQSPSSSAEEVLALSSSSMCASSSSGCSVLGTVGDSEEELWTETASRFEVHILLRLFANEQVHIFHMGVECGVSLSFLVPDKPSSDNYYVAARDV